MPNRAWLLCALATPGLAAAADDQWYIAPFIDTDSVGKPAYNLKLSQRRAESVLDYLLKKGSVRTSWLPRAMARRSRWRATRTGQVVPRTGVSSCTCSPIPTMWT